MTSWISPKTEKRGSEIEGRGLFAREAIPRGEIVAVKGGRIYDRAGWAKVAAELSPAEIQIGDDHFIGPADASGVEANMLRLNHSCEPNCGVRGEITFVTMRDVAPEEELTIDYAMIDGDPEIHMKCRCGSGRCRGSVSGADWALPRLQEEYRGHFSTYLQRRIDSVRRPV